MRSVGGTARAPANTSSSRFIDAWVDPWVAGYLRWGEALSGGGPARSSYLAPATAAGCASARWQHDEQDDRRKSGFIGESGLPSTRRFRIKRATVRRSDIPAHRARRRFWSKCAWRCSEPTVFHEASRHAEPDHRGGRAFGICGIRQTVRFSGRLRRGGLQTRLLFVAGSLFLQCFFDSLRGHSTFHRGNIGGLSKGCRCLEEESTVEYRSQNRRLHSSAFLRSHSAAVSGLPTSR